MIRLDRYILGKFLGNFFFFMALVMAIAAVFDVSQKLDDFMHEDLTLGIIIKDYYINFVAFYGNTFSALILFLSTVFFTARMANNTEITAIFTGGVSFWRLIRPYMIGAGIVFLITATMSHFVIPSTNGARIAFEDEYVFHRRSSRDLNIHRQILPGHMIYVETWNKKLMGGYNFTYEVYDGSEMLERFDADFIKFNPQSETWRCDSWSHRIHAPDGSAILRKGLHKDTAFAFTTQQISPDERSIETMASPELWEFLEQQRISGSEALGSYLMKFHRRTAYPFSAFILVFIAVILAGRKIRGGVGAQIALGLIIAVTYIFFMQMTSVLIEIQFTTPLVAVWTPNIIFMIVAAILAYRR